MYPSIIPSMGYAFGVKCKNALPGPRSSRFFLMFVSKSLTAFHFPFKAKICFECIFVYDVRLREVFPPPPHLPRGHTPKGCPIASPPANLKKLLSSVQFLFATLSKFRWAFLCGSVSGFSVPSCLLFNNLSQ